MCRLLHRAADDLGIEVPEGFEVSLYADDTLAHDIYSMTIDAQGRVVVAGAGYVKILHDDDQDGRADRATLFSSLPASGAHGMYFDGPDLICTGDNSVMRQRDTDGDGVADGPIERWTELRHPEHGANGISRGPDGCYYIICGNDAGVSEKQITTAGSPVKKPRCGAVVRLSPDGKPLDVYAHGFRNPYDLDFDAAGHLFTVDADGERDHHLPWYAPTRLFDIAQGQEHGWLLMGWTRGWNRPPSLLDSMERIVEIGRGSPTGLVVYRHHAFGPHYRGGVFSACWSLGCVYFMPLEAVGATSRSKLETFLRTTGDVGFAPCDLAVGPAGDLFIAIGGRRTRGSVFRVHATKTGATLVQNANQPLDLPGILSADQPLASWSRARWKPAAEKLGVAAFQDAADDESLTVEQRVRAIEIVVELCGGADTAWAAKIANFPQPQLRARIAWALGKAAHLDDAEVLLSRLTADPDPTVQRAAWESLALADELDAESEIAARLEPGPQQPRASRAHRGDCRGPRARRQPATANGSLLFLPSKRTRPPSSVGGWPRCGSNAPTTPRPPRCPSLPMNCRPAPPAWPPKATMHRWRWNPSDFCSSAWATSASNPARPKSIAATSPNWPTSSTPPRARRCPANSPRHSRPKIRKSIASSLACWACWPPTMRACQRQS